MYINEYFGVWTIQSAIFSQEQLLHFSHVSPELIFWCSRKVCNDYVNGCPHNDNGNDKYRNNDVVKAKLIMLYDNNRDRGSGGILCC